MTARDTATALRKLAAAYDDQAIKLRAIAGNLDAGTEPIDHTLALRTLNDDMADRLWTEAAAALNDLMESNGRANTP